MRRLVFAVAVASVVFILPHRLTAAPACQMDLQATLPLGFANGLATVEVKINGHPATVGFDTGAQTLVTPEAVKAFNISRDWRRTRAIGTNTVIIANNVVIRDFEFAGRNYRAKSVANIGLPAEKNAATPIMGLIGTDVLADFDLDFDFPNRSVRVYKVVNCKTVSPPGFTIANTIPFTFNFQRSALLKVQLDKTNITAILDTGASYHSITRAAASRLKVNASTLNTDISADAMGIGDVVVKRSFHQFQSLTVGNETVETPLFGILNTPIVTGDILLGQKFLFSRRFFISNATRTLLLEKLPAAAFTYTPSVALRLAVADLNAECNAYPILKSMGRCSNASVNAKPVAGYLGLGTGYLSEECLKYLGSGAKSGIIVKGFSLNSPALKAGLLWGDILISIDGKPIADSAAFVGIIRSLPPGGTIKLNILRKGIELSLDAVLDDFTVRSLDKVDVQAQTDQAVDANRAILDQLPEGGCKMERALTQVFLGNSLQNRGGSPMHLGDRELSIAYLEVGLATLDGKRFAQDWGRGYISLGRAYLFTTSGDPILNTQKAIEAFSTAISVAALPRADRGRAFTGRGTAFTNKKTGDITDNFNQAFRDFGSASVSLDEKESPKDWAYMHRMLADAYLKKPNGERAANIAEAIKELTTASYVYGTQNAIAERDSVLTQIDELKKQQAKAAALN